MRYKETEIYQRLRAFAKKLLYLRDIKISRYSGSESIEELYSKFVNGIDTYLSELEQENRIGYFSKSSNTTSIYAFVYWTMLNGLLNREIEGSKKNEIANLLQSFQYPDGLCWDANISNIAYLNGDGWGARHFMPHYFIALERLNISCKYELNYLSPYHDACIVSNLLNSLDWTHPWESSNVVMNIATGLFYERDIRKNSDATVGITAIQKWLVDNIRPDCGMWGIGNLKSRYFRYQMIRGAYHLFYILLFDNIEFPYQKKAIDCILKLQNKYGGYDYQRNSSACEDIDAIEPLIRLSLINNDYKKKEIEDSIKKSLYWVVQNQMSDGGCVFRMGEKICYGSKNMSAIRNESNLFATWFRTLSVCYMYDYLTGNRRKYVNLAGYEYPIFRET